MGNPASCVFHPQQVRELDRFAITELGIPGFELMNRAGRAVWDLIRRRHPGLKRLLVVCGGGNNAGDGYVIARLARVAGVDVLVAALADPRRLQDDAARAWGAFRDTGGEVHPFSIAACAGREVIVDALLGTGTTRPLEGAWLHAVETINGAGLPVFSVDVPSGLCALTGHELGAAVRATATVTFIGRKLGLYVGNGPEYCGEIVFDDLDLPIGKLAHVAAAARLVDRTDLLRCLPRRARGAHKGSFGHVLVVGGNKGMGGALRLAAEAALLSGAGLVSAATRPGNVPGILAARPEIMCHGVGSAADFDPLLERATILAMGPGLGTDSWAEDLWTHALAARQPMVVDADALNLLARRPQRGTRPWVLTPHPGEAARLLGGGVADVQRDRLASARAISERYGGICVLKGRCSVVDQAGELPFLIDAGNPGMASGGMGDVLAGVTAALMGQNHAPDFLLAAACAASVHARAGDDAARSGGGERGLTAGDLLKHLRPWLNPAN